MNEIKISTSKTLRLQNVLKNTVIMDENTNFAIEVNKMLDYIKIHGAKQLGPLVQKTNVKTKSDDDAEIHVTLMLQMDRFLNKVENPYSADPLIRVQNCVYAHYSGPEKKLSLAQKKIEIYAFENDIELVGESYCVYVSNNKENETSVVDVFMPIKE